jgi:hypothetical protein
MRKGGMTLQFPTLQFPTLQFPTLLYPTLLYPTLLSHPKGKRRPFGRRQALGILETS